jgi:hypothetical protein
MDLDQALELYEEYMHGELEAPKARKNNHLYCDECDAPLTFSNVMQICKDCGLAEPIGAVVMPVGIVVKRSLYRRRSYFIERMNLLCGYKQCCQVGYRAVVKQCNKWASTQYWT